MFSNYLQKQKLKKEDQILSESRVGKSPSHHNSTPFPLSACRVFGARGAFWNFSLPILCLLAATYSSTIAEIAPTPSYTQLTSTATTETDADWSPDGEWIAYSDGNNNSDIWIIPATGGEPRQLTTDPGNDILPRWSPDGKRLLFVSDRGSGQRNVWTISTDGKVETLFQVTTDTDSLYMNIVNWSPDGSRIVYSAKRGKHVDLWVISDKGENARQITNLPGWSWDPDWSPDGKWIAYNFKAEDDDFGATDLWVVSAAGGTPRPLLNEPGAQFCPAWSPDGEWIAYCGFRPDDIRPRMDVWLFPSNGGKPQRVSDSNYVNFRPRWAPNGRHLLYDATENIGMANIYDIGSQTNRLIIPSMAAIRALDWSPDGRSIVFLQNAADGFDIWRQAVTGGEPLKITTNGAFSMTRNASLSWSPDGRLIAFNPILDGEGVILTIPAAGGEPDRIDLGVEKGTIGNISWSPEGSTIAFNFRTLGNWDIWTVPSAGGRAEKLLDWSGHELDATWSPDGQKIVFAASGSATVEHTGGEFDSAIWMLSVGDGQVSKLTEGERPHWLPGGKEISFVRDGGEVFKIPAGGGEAARVEITENPPWSNWERMWWSPDGHQILYGDSKSRNLWIADIESLIN